MTRTVTTQKRFLTTSATVTRSSSCGIRKTLAATDAARRGQIFAET